MNVFSLLGLLDTDFHERRCHGSEIGCLDIQDGRIVGSGYGWSEDREGLSETPVANDGRQSNSPPHEFDDGTVRLFGSFSCWEFITFE